VAHPFFIELYHLAFIAAIYYQKISNQDFSADFSIHLKADQSIHLRYRKKFRILRASKFKTGYWH
jgi:hypothetical protein